jgi:ligand-binding SRPBCC domain-containing protein
LRLRLRGVPIRWRTVIDEWRPPRSFTDRQLAGPYRLWLHVHRLTPVRGGTEIHDSVTYRVPGGPLAAAVDRALVRPWLDEIFDYRAERLRELL